MTINCDFLKPFARKTERFDRAIDVINAGLRNQTIRNVDLKDAISILSDTVYNGWQRHVSSPYFQFGKYRDQTDAANALNDNISVSNLHEVKFLVRKLGSTQATGPAVDAMREFMQQVLPLALAVDQLKPLIVKGRVLSEPAPVNPNKVIKTCPCCFRPIAIVPTKMARHGYKRPRDYGYQTASCPGIRFKPLEVSSNGLLWMIEQTMLQLNRDQFSLENCAQKKTLLIRNPEVAKREMVEIDSSSVYWEKAFKHYCQQLGLSIEACTQELNAFKTRLEHWKPSGE